ncbi:MAG TPA: ABC transporter permease [Acidobacteriaceae bacterium]
MWNGFWFRLRALWRRRAEESDLNDELRFHFEKQVEKLRITGIGEQEARRQARLIFGSHEQVKEDCREARGTSFVENARQDLRYAIRQLRANPTFAIVIVLTLALSIGANSAIFSVIHGVLIQPLPYRQPDKLVRAFFTIPAFPKFPFNPFDFRDFRARNRSFVGMAAFTRSDLQLSGSGEPTRLHGMQITSGYFNVLGLSPQLGREFDAQGEVPGNGRQVILSDRLWRSRFGAARDIIGRKITLNEQPFTVVGVMPARTAHPGNEYQPLAYGQDVDVWSPFTFEGDPARRGSHFMEVIGRLKPGVSMAQANAEMNTLLRQISNEHGGYGDWKILLISLNDEVIGTSRQMLLVLLGAVAMVLLIACANAANLMLTRAAARRREIAVRVALGAPRSRVVRQLLTESLLISSIGGALGLLLAFGGVKALVSLLPANFPRAQDIHVSAPVFLFTLLISVGTGVVFGLAPALQASRTDPKEGLHRGGRATTGGGRQSRLRNGLVISEVGLACVLLIGAGLMLRSLLNLMHLDPGFQTDHVVTAMLSLPPERYKTPESAVHFIQELPEHVRSLPGVESAGVGSDIPWTGYDDNAGFTIEGKQPPPHEDFHGRYHMATPGYFQALGIPLLRGRFFTDADNMNGPLVMIVNHAMAQRYWPGEDALGKRITFDDNPKEKDWIRIVGIVGDVKDQPNSPGAEPAYWWPFSQTPVGKFNLLLAVRSKSDPQLLVSAIRQQVAHLDPALAVADIRTMDQIVTASVATPRFAFVLVGLFGGLAIVLAAIGTYGVIAYSVTQRTAEFGLRMALGAQRLDVLRLVLLQAGKMVLAGTVAGIVLALVFAQALKSLIYQVSPADPLTFAVIGAAVVLIAILAGYVPARKATRADPMVALRAE